MTSIQYPPPTNRTYYVSGPISGDIEGNTKKFTQAVRDLRARGYRVVSPVEVCEVLTVPDPSDWAWYMRRDIEAMLQDEVTGIIMLPGWEHSRGAQLELLVAKGLNYYIAELAPCLVRTPRLEAKFGATAD